MKFARARVMTHKRDYSYKVSSDPGNPISFKGSKHKQTQKALDKMHLLIQRSINSGNNVIYESNIYADLSDTFIECNPESKIKAVNKVIKLFIEAGFISNKVRGGKYYYILKQNDD